MEKQSKKYQLNKADMKKAGKVFLYAGASSLAAILLEILNVVDFGKYQPIVVAIINVLAVLVASWNAGKKA